MASGDKWTREELIIALRKGDREAVEYLYRHAFHACASYITQNNGTMDDAKDLFQESLMVLFRNLQKPDFELTADVKTFLYSVMRNLWLKQLRKKGRGGLALVVDDDSETEFIIIDEDELEYKREKERKHELIADMMKEIKEDCRELLLNYYFKKIPLKEVGKTMGYSDNFVKVKKNRCMESLRNKVELKMEDI
jgi:RNA polymerase sigma factor (sigma-70 family)